jgi:hypothetical protein
MSRIALSTLSVPLAVALFAFTATAQSRTDAGRLGGATIHGVPASVTSYGFGGQPGFHGVPASVTSLNFGNAPHRMPGVFGSGRHHHNSGYVNPFYPSAVYLPYAYPVYVVEPGPDDTMEQDYASEPVVSNQSGGSFREQVRRDLDALRSEVEDYRAELNSTRRTEEAAQKPEAQEPSANQPKTVLVFKDGHTMEVLNYAIVGDTLYDISDGLTRKFALAELDLPATVNQNGRRGVDFQLPATVTRN